MPGSVHCDLSESFALEFWVELTDLTPGQTLLDSRDERGRGVVVQTTDRDTVEVVLASEEAVTRWDCDAGLLEAGRMHHIVVNVDAGPRIITFIVDGALCDGADHRQFGWGRFGENLRYAGAGQTLRIGPNLKGKNHRLRLYDRYLRTSEVLGNHRAGPGGS